MFSIASMGMLNMNPDYNFENHNRKRIRREQQIEDEREFDREIVQYLGYYEAFESESSCT